MGTPEEEFKEIQPHERAAEEASYREAVGNEAANRATAITRLEEKSETQSENIDRMVSAVDKLALAVLERPTRSQTLVWIFLSDLFKLGVMAVILILIYANSNTNKDTLNSVKSFTDPNSDVRKDQDQRTTALLANLVVEIDCRTRRAIAHMPMPTDPAMPCVLPTLP